MLIRENLCPKTTFLLAMLRDLSIKNFAIIDKIHITFSEGFSVLTGETGAGKSIIINALKLILGGRISTDLIKTGEEHAEVEAFFDIIPDSEAGKAMETQGLDQGEGLTVRRIIARNGKNKIFINGHLSTLHMMTRITENLVSISGQHAHQKLLRPEYHLTILDHFAGLKELRNKVSECYKKLHPLIKTLYDLKEKKGREAEEKELLLFQEKEIARANLCIKEEIDLDHERTRLKNAEKLYGTVGKCIEGLYGSNNSVVDSVTEIGKEIERIGNIDASLIPVAENILSAAYQLEDSVSELRSYINTLSFDQTQLEKIEERQDIIQKLKRKYGETIEDIFHTLDTIEKRLEELRTSSERIADIEEQLFEQNKMICELALQLSKKRKEGATEFCHMMQKQLESLEMRGTQFDILFEYVREYPEGSFHYLTVDGKVIDETGCDRISFLISPNVGEKLKPLANIASGGELSRIILALKALMAGRDDVGTIIFDEVDAGIGGGVAETVGQMMKKLSKHHQQAICITHLPQIASLGDHHFKISKKVDKGRTHTDIEPLNRENRVKEIARMLGGVKISEKTIDHAKEMLCRQEKRLDNRPFTH